MKRNRTILEKLSLALAFIMLIGFFQPLQAFAEGEDALSIGASGEIIAFEELATGVASMTVPLGTPETALVLPDTLVATVRLPEVATPSDSGGGEIDVDVPVKWQALGGYTGDESGSYVFAATVEGGYTVSAGLPEITVTVDEEDNTSLPVVTGGEIIAFAELSPEVANMTVPLGTPETALTLPGTLAATVRLPESATSSDGGGGEIDMDVPVSWKAVAGYDSDISGEYVFIAEIEGEYTLAAVVPTITVEIEKVAVNTFTQTFSNGSFLAPIEPFVVGSTPVSTRAELEAIENSEGSFYLTQDIDLSGANWTPIDFKGTLDGQGHIIRNMTITGEKYQYVRVGLFSSVRGGAVKNLGMEDCHIDVNFSFGCNFGLIAGTSEAWLSEATTIENCYARENEISISTSTSRITIFTIVGGIVGSAVNTDIKNCYNMDNIHPIVSDYNNGVYVGGIVAVTGGSDISNCYNIGDLSAETRVSSALAGGIIGEIDTSSTVRVDGCYNEGSISVIGQSRRQSAGGIIGRGSVIYTRTIIVEDCYNIGAISVDSNFSRIDASCAGGIIGYVDRASISYCYNAGEILSKTWGTGTTMRILGANSGNIVGYIADTASVDRCVALSENVVALDDTDGKRSIAAIIACGNYTGNYNLTHGIGVGASPDQERVTILPVVDFFTQSTYTVIGWDFDSIWMMPDMMPVSYGYPILQWQGDYSSDDDGDDEDELYIKDVSSITNEVITNESHGVYMYGKPVDGTITATVDVALQYISILPSISGATWTLHRNNFETNRYEEIINKTLILIPGENYAFIELVAPGFERAVYMLTVICNSPIGTQTVFFDYEWGNYSEWSNGIGQVSVDWGASLFDKSSMEYKGNADTALAAAALSAAADTLDGDDSRILEAYRTLGFSDRHFYNYNANATGAGDSGTHCFSIASQEMVINGEDHTVIAVVLRGTKSDYEVESYVRNPDDCDFYGHRAWRQSYQYYKEVETAFWQYIQDYNLRNNKIKLLITGHSLGGAAANLFAASFELSGQSSIPLDNIYAFTFGALNSISSQNQVSGLGYINNIFNFRDTYGPEGDGAIFGDGEEFDKPSHGWKTISQKFGHILEFDGLDYNKMFDTASRNANHTMPGYVDALVKNALSDGKSSTRVVVLCPVDVEVYDSSNRLVGRTINNIVDELATTVPMFVEGTAKYISLPQGEYTLKLSAFDQGVMHYVVESVNSSVGIPECVKYFENVDLVAGKKMFSGVGGNITVPDTALYVVDDSDNIIAEIHENGSETSVTSGNGNDNTPVWLPETPVPGIGGNGGVPVATETPVTGDNGSTVAPVATEIPVTSDNGNGSAPVTAVPQTGDNSDFVGWVVAFSLSIVGILWILVQRKRHYSNKAR